ncbi:Sec-independent protein translocase protein TATA, chloroplastic [Morella rubra]|uniref:Sec-independent protein translocase protein TATA, chloroplastic n=1 Tax=Morella rubra TaxID=262757 RepID=A0A6A1UR33_9ROSI|nr:Sec-independent protein translocase protein TATA, chloroplastic [Morella rubra]
MEISSLALSFSSTLRIASPSLPLSSSNSTFLTSIATTPFFSKTKPKSNALVVTRTRTRTEPAKKGLTCNALFGLGVPELVVIAGVAALVFGPKKLPEVGKSIGKTVKSFQQIFCAWVLYECWCYSGVILGVPDVGIGSRFTFIGTFTFLTLSWVRLTLLLEDFKLSQDGSCALCCVDLRSKVMVCELAAKEFESELKKEPDSMSESPVEKPASFGEEEKQDIKVSSSKENV